MIRFPIEKRLPRRPGRRGRFCRSVPRSSARRFSGAVWQRRQRKKAGWRERKGVSFCTAKDLSRAGRFFLLAGMESLHTGGRRIRRAFFVCRWRNFLPAELTLTGEPLPFLAGKARRHPPAALCGEGDASCVRNDRPAARGDKGAQACGERTCSPHRVGPYPPGRGAGHGKASGGRAPVPSVADRTCRQEKRKERRPQRPTPCTEETDSLRESWRKPLNRAGSPKARPARRLAVVTASC